MALEKLTDNVEIHQTLGDAPNSEGMTASDLKAKFDEAAKIIKQFINDRIVPNALDKRGDTMRGVLRLGGNRLVDLPEPKEENDATNKAYVDAGLAGKAPAGYGLGGGGTVTVLANIDELDTLVRSGWYTVNLEEGGFLTPGYWVKYMSVRVDAYTFNALTQTVRRSDLDTVLQRHRTEGVWGEWEHVNPAMELNKEYRTTERHKGKIVYTQLVDIGYLPNATTKTVSCASFTELVDYHGTTSSTYVASNLFVEDWLTSFYISKAGKINLKTNADMTAQTATVQIWYTKD